MLDRTFNIHFFKNILPAGADRIPAAVPADIPEHLRRHRFIDPADQILIDIFLFFQMKILDHLAVIGENFRIVCAEPFALLFGTCGAERVGGEGDPHPEGGIFPEMLRPAGHVADEVRAVALAAVALCAQEVMRAHNHDIVFSHEEAPSTWALIRALRSFLPRKPAISILMIAVGMKGSTQAVKATVKLLSAANTNQHMPMI